MLVYRLTISNVTKVVSKDQSLVRFEVAKNRVPGEITLLCIRAENNQTKVAKLDREIDQTLQNEASGDILDLLLEMCYSDVRKRRLSHTTDGDIHKLGCYGLRENIWKRASEN